MKVTRASLNKALSYGPMMIVSRVPIELSHPFSLDRFLTSAVFVSAPFFFGQSLLAFCDRRQTRTAGLLALAIFILWCAAFHHSSSRRNLDSFETLMLLGTIGLFGALIYLLALYFTWSKARKQSKLTPA